MLPSYNPYLTTATLPDLSLVQKIAHVIFCRSVVSVTPILAGLMNWKFEIELRSGELFIIRFYPKERTHLVAFEPDLMRECFVNGMLVPEVIADSRSMPDSPWAYTVYRKLIGVTLSSRLRCLHRNKLNILADDVYCQLSLMASLPVRGFGELQDSNHGIRATWHEFVSESFETGISQALKLKLISQTKIAQLEFVSSQLGYFSTPSPAGIAWGDVSPDNLIIDAEDRLVGLIDFEGALSAEFCLNFGYLAAAYPGGRLSQALHEVWRADTAQRRRANLYSVIRALRIMQHADKPLPAGKARDPIDSFLPGFLPSLEQLVAALT
jgi:aminoglycoside phosphotransferase (APT) family kinase protein